MTITMIALKPLKYAGASVAKGGKFEVRGRSDARVLQAIGHAEPAKPTPVVIPAAIPVPLVYQRPRISMPPREAPEAEIKPETPAEDGQPKPKRQYRRRDMTASDSSET